MVTAGHFTAPATSLGSLPPSIRIFASFSPTDAKDPKDMDSRRRASDSSVDAALSAAASVRSDRRDSGGPAPARDRRCGLVLLEHAPPGIGAARVADPGTLDRSEGAPMTIVGYGTTTPRIGTHLPTSRLWDGRRRIRTSTLRRVVDETWALWSIPSYVCSGDSGGAIFLNPSQAWPVRRSCRQRERRWPRLPTSEQQQPPGHAEYPAVDWRSLTVAPCKAPTPHLGVALDFSARLGSARGRPRPLAAR